MEHWLVFGASGCRFCICICICRSRLAARLPALLSHCCPWRGPPNPPRPPPLQASSHGWLSTQLARDAQTRNLALACLPQVTDNTTGNGIPSTDFKLWITLSCPVGKSEVSVGLLVEATEPREDVIETGDAQPVVLGVDVLFVRLDGKKVQGRDPKGKEYFPDVTMAAPKPKPRPRAPVPEAAPAPAATPAPEATPAPSPAPAAPSPALAA
ncbi:hypothetical protein ABPG75_004395 [Micractinium tetrahymenae]